MSKIKTTPKTATVDNLEISYSNQRILQGVVLVDKTCVVLDEEQFSAARLVFDKAKKHIYQGYCSNPLEIAADLKAAVVYFDSLKPVTETYSVFKHAIGKLPEMMEETVEYNNEKSIVKTMQMVDTRIAKGISSQTDEYVLGRKEYNLKSTAVDMSKVSPLVRRVLATEGIELRKICVAIFSTPFLIKGEVAKAVSAKTLADQMLSMADAMYSKKQSTPKK